MRLDSFDSDTQMAVRIVRDSIRLARSLEGRARASITSDMSPVTVADLCIQAVVAARLAEACPHDSLIAEEDARLLRADPDLSVQVVEVVRQRSLVIEEAGGRVTDLAGQPLDFTCGRRLLRNMGMLASNGLLHRAALEAIQRST
jgi:3'-phosphoadenosine 5'-phosphosulfate (PAPS) 3'-phosphatase